MKRVKSHKNFKWIQIESGSTVQEIVDLLKTHDIPMNAKLVVRSFPDQMYKTEVLEILWKE